MDTYSIGVKEAVDFANFLEGLRGKKSFIECIGVNGSEKNFERNYVFPFKEYGSIKEACLLVNGNTFALMLLYDEYRISYALQAQSAWTEVILESFGGEYKYCSYDYFNELSERQLQKIENLFLGKFKEGSNNLYNVLGRMAGNVDFLQNYIKSN